MMTSSLTIVKGHEQMGLVGEVERFLCLVLFLTG